MILRNRVIWSDNGVLKDISDSVNNHISGTVALPLVAAQDYIFLGSDAPFNHRWIELGVVNDVASRIAVHVWDGDSWVPVAETIDLTLNPAGDTTLAVSGRLAWVPTKNKSGWQRDDTKDTSNSTITGLGAVEIYDLFWARLTFTGNLKATTEIKYLGWKFANDEDLYASWTEFDTTEARERFRTGITTFDQVHFEAAKAVIRDLKAQDVVASGNQVLEWEIMRLPAVHKAAELIYTAYGSDWEKERLAANTAYRNALKVELYNTDLNEDGILSPRELAFRTGRLVR